MPREFDAFAGYPEPPAPRVVGPHQRTIHNRIVASYRDKAFYDGERINGYGGMVDDGRWGPIADRLIDTYKLHANSCVLQVGAHKGFLLEALHQRHIRVAGTEFSEYPARQSKTRLYRAPFTKLPFEDESFDLVIGVSCVYTLNLPDAIKCLREIRRVSRGQSFITLAAYENEEDIEGLLLLRYWFLLGTTILTKADWLAVMDHAGYTGDYRFDTAAYLNLVRG
jgi:SAM-dependent methyltransferase